MFELTRDGLKLTAVAPGIEIEKGVLVLTGMPPLDEELRSVDARIFRRREMNLHIDLLHFDLPERVAVDPATQRLFLDSRLP